MFTAAYAGFLRHKRKVVPGDCHHRRNIVVSHQHPQSISEFCSSGHLKGYSLAGRKPGTLRAICLTIQGQHQQYDRNDNAGLSGAD